MPLFLIVIVGLFVLFAVSYGLWRRHRQDSDTTVSVHLEARPIVLSNDDRLNQQAPGRANSGDAIPAEFVVVHLETTGLSAGLDEIVEIGALKIKGPLVGDETFSTLVRPTRRSVPSVVTDITGITQQMVEVSGVAVQEALHRLIEFNEGLPIVAFNAEFNMRFLHVAANHCGLAIGSPYVCAMELARQAFTEIPRHRLVDFGRRLHLSIPDRRRALDTCKIAKAIFISSAEKLGQKIRWSTAWLIDSTYMQAKNVNGELYRAAREIEDTDPAKAIDLYAEANQRVFEYEKRVGSREADPLFLNRLTLCLLKLARNQEVIDHVKQFVCQFPDTQSSIMAGVLKRSEKASSRLSVAALPVTRKKKIVTLDKKTSGWARSGFDKRLTRAWQRYGESATSGFRFAREDFLRSLRQQWTYVFGYVIEADVLKISQRLDIKAALASTSEAEKIFQVEEHRYPMNSSPDEICQWIRGIENRVLSSRGLSTWEGDQTSAYPRETNK
jgi:DNA polymerase III subunit epsilon